MTTYVIGAGVIGLACAAELQRRGCEVVVIDKASPGLDCSYGNAGILATSEILPLITARRLAQLPKLLFARDGPASIVPAALPGMAPWFWRAARSLSTRRQSEIISGLMALNFRAIGAWRSLLQACDADDLLIERGMIVLARSLSDLAELEDQATYLRSHGVSGMLLQRDSVRELEPTLDGEMAGALLHQDVAHVRDPFAVVTALVQRLLKGGANIEQQHVCELRPIEGGIELIAEGSTRLAETIVVAAGLGSGELVSPLGYTVPLAAERGYHLMLPCEKDALTRPVTFARESCVATPMTGGLRIAGTVEFAHAGDAARWRRADQLRRNAGRYFGHSLDRSGESQWMGSRPSLPDSLPAIGRCRSAPRVVYAFGHQHLGLTQAAVTAELVSDLISQAPPKIDETPYSLERFASWSAKIACSGAQLSGRRRQ